MFYLKRFQLILLPFVFVAVLDTGCFLAVRLAAATGLSGGHLARSWEGIFHPLVTGKPLRPPTRAYQWAKRDPWYGHRNIPQNPDGIYATDVHGFIKNSPREERNLRTKDPGEYRVFLLGGSTLVGHGVT